LISRLDVAGGGRIWLMAEPITPEQAAAYVERWRLVNEVEREELRRTPPAAKLQQVEALAEMAEVLGWREALGADDERVRELWRRLRAARVE
jgi:hypothetical protein